MYSGGEKHRKGVAFIMGKRIINSVLSYQTISERHMTLKLSGRTRNVLIHQVYAPNMDDDDEEVEKLYRSIEIEGKRQKKWKDIVIVLGDFNAKVGSERYEGTVGPYGVGQSNEMGQRLIEFCVRERESFICNTWFQQKLTSRSTWRHPNGKDENQIHYILVDKRYRNSITNAKVRKDADCGSDHDPVWMNMRVKLKKQKRRHACRRWNLENLKIRIYKISLQQN